MAAWRVLAKAQGQLLPQRHALAGRIVSGRFTTRG